MLGLGLFGRVRSPRLQNLTPSGLCLKYGGGRCEDDACGQKKKEQKWSRSCDQGRIKRRASNDMVEMVDW